MRMLTLVIPMIQIIFLPKGINADGVIETQKNNFIGDCAFGSAGQSPTLSYSNVSAELKVDFPRLPLSCNYTSYHIIIRSNVTELQSETNDCNEHNFAVHSDRLVRGSNKTLLTAVFRYLYTGLYCIEIIPKEQLNSKKPYYLTAAFNSVLSRPDVVKWNTTLFVETNRRERSVRARFTNGPPEIDFERYRVQLRPIVLSCDETFTGKGTLSREVTPDSLDVVFSNMTPGNYCIFIRPLDERCHPDRVWGNTKSCLRHSIVYELLPPGQEPMELNTTHRDISILITGLVVALLLISAVLYYMASRTKLFTLIRRSGTASELVKKIASSESSRVSLSKWDNCRPASVLLLYSRDEEIQSHIEALKKFLVEHGKCKVADIFDEESYQSIAVLGSSWVSALITDPTVRIVIVSSPSAVAIQENLVQGHKQTPKRDLHPFDPLFVQGLKEIMDLMGMDGSAYERVFLIRFSEIPPLEPILSFVSPFTLFSMPQHLSSLVKHLHGLSEVDETEPFILPPIEDYSYPKKQSIA